MTRDAEGGYRRLQWGMTRADVSNADSGTNVAIYWNTRRYTRHVNYYTRPGYIMRYQVKRFFLMDEDNRLVKIWIYFRKKQRRKIVKMYNNLYEVLCQKYGEPVREIYCQEKGYHVYWATPSTIIEMRCDYTGNVTGDVLTLVYSQRGAIIDVHFDRELEYREIRFNALDDL